MPPIRSARNRKPPPAGFDDLEDTLLEFSNKMKDAENDSGEGKKKYEVLWPIFQISHQRTCQSKTFGVCPSGPHPPRVKLMIFAPPFYTRPWLTILFYRITLHLRSLLRETSYLKATIRLASEE